MMNKYQFHYRDNNGNHHMVLSADTMNEAILLFASCSRYIEQVYEVRPYSPH
jgi:hypothetical protein